MYTSAIATGSATDWIGFAPYSRICVPETLIALNRGLLECRRPRYRRQASPRVRAGKSRFRARYTLSEYRFELCRADPCAPPLVFLLRGVHMARMMGAVALMVNEVETLSRGIPSKIRSKSARVSTATPNLPTSSSPTGSSESRPTWVGRSKSKAQARLSVLQEEFETLVGAFGGRLTGVLAHCRRGCSDTWLGRSPGYMDTRPDCLSPADNRGP